MGPHSRRDGADSGYQHHSGNPGTPQKSLFLRGRTLWFCLLGEQPEKGLLSGQGEGNVQGPELQLLQAQLQCWVTVSLPLPVSTTPGNLELRASVQTSGMFWTVTTLALFTHPYIPISILSLSQSSVDGTAFLFLLLPWVYFLGF